MSWYVILIFVLVFCAMLGPVLMLKLNKRQQALADLRQKALTEGLKVTMAQLNKESIAVYLLEWPREEDARFGDKPWKLERKNYVHAIHLADYWYWADGVEPGQSESVAAILSGEVIRLPAGVKAVIADPRGLGCYWTESGGEAALEAIKSWLSQVQPRLWPLVRVTEEEHAAPAERDATEEEDQFR